MKVKKQKLEPDVEQWTGLKLGKEYFRAMNLTYLESKSCKMLGWMSWNQAKAGIKLAGRNINNLRFKDDTTFMAETKKN